ncbi:NUDIX hydrolase [Kribbella sp. NPDC020789]
MTVRRYGGVVASYDGWVALVREQFERWDKAYWSLPSGAIELGESPEAGSVRELAEESGLKAPESSLRLVWRATVVVEGEVTSNTWNYATEVEDDAFAVDDPDGSILEARWFQPAEAADLLTQLPYPPLSVPAVEYLRTGTPIDWTFTCTGSTWNWASRPLNFSRA